jgi:hypothetical protein
MLLEGFLPVEEVSWDIVAFAKDTGFNDVEGDVVKLLTSHAEDKWKEDLLLLCWSKSKLLKRRKRL